MSVKQPKFEISPDNVHLDELVWETIIMRNGQSVHQVWKFEKAYFPCGRCKMPDNVKFMTLPTGAYKACKYCGFAEGIEPVNIDSGEETAEKLVDEVVSVEEAWSILIKHKAHPYAPLSLPPAKPNRKRVKLS